MNARDYLADVIRNFEMYENDYPDDFDRGYLYGLKRALAIIDMPEILGPRYSSIYFLRAEPERNVKTVVDE